MSAKTTKAKKIESTQAAEILSRVATLDPATVTGELARAQVTVQQTLANLGSQVTNQIAQLREVETAIDLKKVELRALHQIEVEANTLDQLQAAIAETKQQWSDEQTTHQQDINRRNSESQRRRIAEEQLYVETRDHDRTKAERDWDMRMEDRRRNEGLRQQDLERGWKEREAVIKQQETTFAQLQQQVTGMPDAIKKEAERQAAIAGNAVKSDYQQRMNLMQKDMETSTRIAENAIAGLQAQVKQLQTEKGELLSQVEKAQTAVREIAAKAADSVSGQAALQAVLQSKQEQNSAQQRR